MCDLVVVVFRDFEKASLDIITNYFLLTYIATCNVLFSVLQLESEPNLGQKEVSSLVRVSSFQMQSAVKECSIILWVGKRCPVERSLLWCLSICMYRAKLPLC